MSNLSTIKIKALLLLAFSPTITHASSSASLTSEVSSHSSAHQSTMRLSAQIEVIDLRPFITANPTYETTNYIRFSFQHAPGTEIGRIPISSLVQTNRLSINDTLPIPNIDNFVIVYDFRDDHNQRLGVSRICSSKHIPTGRLAKFNGADILSAVRLEAIVGSEENHGPIRFLLIKTQKYGKSTPSALATSTFGNLAPEGSLLNDPDLIEQALAKYPKPVRTPATASSSDDPQNAYESTYQPDLKESSLLIAGEYVKLAREKYGEYPTPADANALLALMRAYGVVATRTADELATELGLK